MEVGRVFKGRIGLVAFLLLLLLLEVTITFVLLSLVFVCLAHIRTG